MFNAEVRASLRRIERLEVGPDKDIFIGARGVSPPCDFACIGIQPGKPPANAKFPAAVADQHLALCHDRSHGDGFAHVDVAQLRSPNLLPRVCVHRDGVNVQDVVINFAVGV